VAKFAPFVVEVRGLVFLEGLRSYRRLLVVLGCHEGKENIIGMINTVA